MELNLEELRELEQLTSRIAKNMLSLAPVLKLVKEVGDNCVVPPVSDRFVRTGDAAKILNVNEASITTLVKDNLLTPYYVPYSKHRRFKVSEVKALAKTQPWANAEDSDD